MNRTGGLYIEEVRLIPLCEIKLVVGHNAAPRPSAEAVDPHSYKGCGTTATNCLPPVICMEVTSVHEHGVCTAKCVWGQIMQVRRGLVLHGE